MIGVSQADRDKWNARFAAAAPAWDVHPIVAEVAGAARVLELASGPSGSALALAAAGAQVTCVDIAEVALQQRAADASRRALRVQTIVADLDTWVADGEYDLVLALRYWDAAVFRRAARAVAPGGTLAWETFALGERRYRPGFPAAFCLRDDEPASLLPEGFAMVKIEDRDDGTSATRRLLARRT